MGRNYKCKTCGEVHAAPTGKHCDRLEREQAPAPQQQTQTDDTQSKLLAAMVDLQSKFATMDENMREMKADKAAERRTHTPEEASVIASEEGAVGGQPEEAEQASPETLRRDTVLMRQASRQLARLRQEDWEDDEDLQLATSHLAGKKSGSIMTASDIVVRRIDWPHFYIKRISGATRKGVVFRELKVEEFVFGFLCMLEAPHIKMQFRYMVKLLRHIMQDTIDFSWENARNFYEFVGLDVEQGAMKWTDEEVVREMRMTYSRTVFPPRRDGKETAGAPRPALQQAPSGMKCCAPFQRKECEVAKGHSPFTHACAYCHRVKSALCRHAEQDCYRKTTDQAKNGKQGE